MARARGATNTQKMIILALSEGWRLRFVDLYGWSLFQPGRSRPFARLKTRTVEAMTTSGWLSEGQAVPGLGYRPVKDLTALGEKYARQLVRENWAGEEWDALDHTTGSYKLDAHRKAA